MAGVRTLNASGGPGAAAGEELIDHPPWIVYRRDIGRLMEYAQLHRLGDSAVAIKRLLDEALAASPSGPQDAGLTEALSDLVSYAENVPIHDGRWAREHGHDWRANIAKAHDALAASPRGDGGEDNNERAGLEPHHPCRYGGCRDDERERVDRFS